MTLDIAARRADFHAMHDDGYFLLPTAWDASSAKRIETLGYAGLASTNTSLALALGCDPVDITRDDVLAHMRLLVNATEIAVNADFGFGFATDTAELTANVRLAVDTGIAALSIGDRASNSNGLEDFDRTVARVRTSRSAIAMSGADVLLVARSDGLLTNSGSFSDTIKRLVAYSNAGADVLCVSGLSDLAAIKAIVLAVAPKPLDVQLTKSGVTAMELGQLGVRRISVGDSFAEMSWASFEHAAEEFIDYGDLAHETIAPE